MKTRTWIIIFALIVVLGLVSFFFFRNDGNVAIITVDGKEYTRIDLSSVKKPYDFKIETEYGYNIIHVEKNNISVADANCPDHICMQMGKTGQGGTPIICMPHRLYIAVSGGEVDA